MAWGDGEGRSREEGVAGRKGGESGTRRAGKKQHGMIEERVGRRA